MAKWHEDMNWNEHEKELMSLRAKQLRRADPDIPFEKLFRQVQLVIPEARRTYYFEPDVHSWILVASYKGTVESMAKKIDALYELVGRIWDRLQSYEAQSDPLYIPLSVTTPEPADEAAKAWRQIGIRLEDDEFVDRLLGDLKAEEDVFAGSPHQRETRGVMMPRE